MTSKKTKFSVGLFVIAGVIIMSSALIWFGLSNYLEKGRFYAAYFGESVQGLGKDSAVKYRGVNIGRVESIDVASDNTLICVVLKIEKDIELTPEMVAQLKSVGITGIVFVELDKKRKNDPDLSPKITFQSEYPVVDTRPSELKKYMRAIDDVLNQLHTLDVKGISDRAKSTLDTINSAVNDVQFKGMSDNIRSSFARLDSLIVNINGTVSGINKTFAGFDQVVRENQAGFSNAISNFTKSMEGASEFLGEGVHLVQKTDRNLTSIQQHLMETMQNLEEASRHLNRSMEEVADQPSTLIFSKPLPEKKNHDGR